jgi:TonB-linked SusC/RagA family outer membrane protein
MRSHRSAMVLPALLACLLWGTQLSAQATTGTVTGRVVDATTQQPIPSASVLVVGTQRGVLTSPDGRFLITNAPAGQQRIRASIIGYSAQEQAVNVTPGQAASVTLELSPTAVQLTEVVAVGYGTQRRADVTGSVASVSTEQLQRTAVTSLQQGLQGAVAGVQVTQGDAAPGGGIRMQIRGTNSFNPGSATPLYVIDGIPLAASGVNKDALGSRREGDLNSLTETNPLATLAPSDIESIEVLKDASATAIYGSRGANGVVIITTRRGRRDSAGQFSFNMTHGLASVVREIPVLDAYGFTSYVNQAYINAYGPDTEYPYGGRVGSRTPEQIRDLVGAGTNWQREIFRDAPTSDYQLGFSGGDDNGTYSIMANWLDQTGVIRGSGFDRTGLRINLDRNVFSAVRVSTNVALTRSLNNMVRTASMSGWRNVGIVRQALTYVPIQWPDTTGTRTDPRAEDAATWSAYGANPLRYTDEVSESDQITRGVGGLRAVTQLGHGLALDISVGSNYERRSYKTYFPRTVNEGRAVNGHAIQAGSEFTNIVSENLLRFNRSVGAAHRLDAITGFTYENNWSTWNSMEAQTFPNDILGANVMQGGSNVFPGQSSISDWQLASFLGRVNYTLLDRYVLTATFRADGSSKFAANNKWAYFPAVAAAWRVVDEPFLANQNLLSDLKLRASYGRSGNQAIGPYESLASLTVNQILMNGVPTAAYVVNRLANPNLKWETTDQYNLGLDFGTWNNRITGLVDVYHKSTYDLLQQISLANVTGFGTAWTNSGEVTNRGVEAQIGVDVLTGENLGGLRWNVSANASRNRNRIETLGTGLEQQFAGRLGSGGGLEATPFIQKEGLPIGAMWGYRTDGLVRTAADSVAYAALNPGAFRIGDVRLVDTNGDGVINAADQVMIGDANPDWTWGLNNRLSLGRFDLSALVTGVHGNDIINTERMRHLTLNGSMNVPREYVENAFHPEINPDGKYPMIRQSRQTIANARFIDAYIEDGSFVRLRNVQLGYQLPLRTAQSARVYVNAINPITWTNYSGYDPEVSAFGSPQMPGVDMGSYPQQRIFQIGVSTTF